VDVDRQAAAADADTLAKSESENPSDTPKDGHDVASDARKAGRERAPRVRPATEEDLERDFGSSGLLIGSPVRPTGPPNSVELAVDKVADAGADTWGTGDSRVGDGRGGTRD
jgi:hypothetical protein